MRNYFTFNNNDSRNYGVYISGSGTYNAPARAYEMVSVPGRNGDLIISQDRYVNTELTYPAFIGDPFNSDLQSFRAMMMSVGSYARLSDSYHPDEYRAAFFADGLEVTPTNTLKGGEFEITFNCKPQRFLVSGESAVEVASTGKLTNPTQYPAKPSIVVQGYGTLNVGGTRMEIANVFSSVVIDSEILDCYANNGLPLVNSAIVGAAILGTSGYVANANNAVTFLSGDFPVLPPGDTRIVYDNTITKVTVFPRWWRL